MSTSRKAFSWSFSVLVHSALGIAMVYTASRIAFPEGSVSSEPVTIETYQQGKASEAPKAEPVADVPEKKIPTKKEVVKAKAPPKVKEAPPKFLPDKNFNEVHAEDPSEEKKETETVPESPVVTKTEVEPPAEVKPAPVETQPEEEPKQTEEKQPVAEAVPEKQPQEEVPPATQEQETAAPKPKASDVQGNEAAAGPHGPQGPMLDESKLEEGPGNHKPSYPYMARLRRQQGIVVLRAFVKKDGTVDLPLLERTSGFPLLDREAITSYSRWHYKPGPSGWVIKIFRFNLTDIK